MLHSTRDIILCSVHVISIACCNWLLIAAMKYISAMHCALICSFEVPLTLLAQETFLRSKHVTEVDGGSYLQIVGSIVVFIAVLSRELVQLNG